MSRQDVTLSITTNDASDIIKGLELVIAQKISMDDTYSAMHSDLVREIKAEPRSPTALDPDRAARLAIVRNEYPWTSILMGVWIIEQDALVG